MTQDYDQGIEQVRVFLVENDIDPDVYRAYMTGVNVGHEIAETNRLAGLSEAEASEYFQKMFLARWDDD